MERDDFNAPEPEGVEHPPTELLDLFCELDAHGVTPEQFAADMGAGSDG